MKKKIIIFTTCILVILSSFSFAFADDHEDYSWLLNKIITFNNVISPSPYFVLDGNSQVRFTFNFGFDYNSLNNTSHFIAFYDDDSGYNDNRMAFGDESTFWYWVYNFNDNSWVDDSFRYIHILSLPDDLNGFIPWLFSNSNAEIFRPVPPSPTIISQLVQPVVNLLGSARSGISSFFEFVTNAFQDVYSIPAVFPSLWALVPSSITSVYLGIFVIVTFMGIIKFLLSK